MFRIRMFGIFLLLAVSSLPGAAQSADSEWERVQRIPATQKVKIHLHDGTKVDGTIRSLGPGGITLVQKKGERLIPFEDIAEITRRSRRWAALWGAVVGAAIGCPIGAAKAGYLTDRNNPSGGDRLGMCAALGGFVGGIGAAIGAAGGMDRTIVKPSAAKTEAAANPRPR